MRATHRPDRRNLRKVLDAGSLPAIDGFYRPPSPNAAIAPGF